MGSVVPQTVSQGRSGLCAPCQCTKGIGYALVMLLVLQLGITVSKGKGSRALKVKNHCVGGVSVCQRYACLYMYLRERD